MYLTKVTIIVLSVFSLFSGETIAWKIIISGLLARRKTSTKRKKMNKFSIFCREHYMMVVVAIVIGVISIFELIAAIRPDFVGTAAKAMMWVSAILLVIASFVCWIATYKECKSVILYALVVTLIAVISTAGIFVPDLHAMALWLNAIMWLMLLVEVLRTIAQEYKRSDED